MRRALFISIALLAAVPAVACAARQHRYTSALQEAILSTANGYPAVGSTTLSAGTVSTSGAGGGALIDRVTITGHPSDAVFLFKGRERDFFASGTLTSDYTGQATVNADGSITFSTSGHFTHGSGVFRGAHGTYKSQGSSPSGSMVTSAHSTGTITY